MIEPRPEESRLQEGQDQKDHPARTGREADHGPGQGRHRPADQPNQELQLQGLPIGRRIGGLTNVRTYLLGGLLIH